MRVKFPKKANNIGNKKMKNLIIGLGSCGISAGGIAVLKHAKSLANNNKDKVNLKTTGCIGMCYNEVLVYVEDEVGKRTSYANVSVGLLDKIFESHILANEVLTNYAIEDVKTKLEKDSTNKRERVVLSHVGFVNPESLSDYQKRRGFKAFAKALKTDRAQIIDEIKKSGLRGRGGGGFPTGVKWSFVHSSDAKTKYLICNADEGDPGAFMDRSVLEGNPYLVLEGMLIAAYAMGCTQGFIYVRAEYPLAIRHLTTAIDKMQKNNLLGENILGSDFSFDIGLNAGAGAFVCGEETALIGSIEGRRGMPRRRPPFPANSGLFEHPTNINNVETFASVPWIILNGAARYSAIGTEKSKGTKVFALAGKVKKAGLVEVPMGVSLREVIFDIGGGIKNDKKFKAVQLGGPSGGCIPESLIDTPIDYESINATGAIMGSGGLVVMDESSCMVDVAKYFLSFTQKESCGKCPFCRIGTKRMLEILERITEGKGLLGDIDKLYSLAEKIKISSLCGLGQTAPNPVLTTLRYFKDEYLIHIREKRCPAGVCTELLTYEIDRLKCIGCTLCAKKCPVGCISGAPKKLHEIDQSNCIKCGNCVTVCRFDAVETK